ncbi:MAG TPA: hypothetical protein VFI43_01980, partial [Nitrosospira sp.]|nr:hypothetical protein [Nitrosospira sp.]
HVFPDTPQSDLERAEANLYYVQVAVPFSKTELNENSIRLSIKGDDAWLPDRLFLFGLDEDETGPAAGFVVPLVHLPEWPLGTLSTDPEEGQGSVVLPLSM